MESNAKKLKLDDSLCNKMFPSAMEGNKKESSSQPWRRPEIIELVGDVIDIKRGHFSFEAIFQRERESKTPPFDYSKYREHDSPSEPIIMSASDMVNVRVYPTRIPLEFLDGNVIVNCHMEEKVEDANRIECEIEKNKDNDGLYENFGAVSDKDGGSKEDVSVNQDDNIDEDNRAKENVDVTEDYGDNEDILIISGVADELVLDIAGGSTEEAEEAYKDVKSSSVKTDEPARNTPPHTPPAQNFPPKISIVTNFSQNLPEPIPKCPQRLLKPPHIETIPTLIDVRFMSNTLQHRNFNTQHHHNFVNNLRVNYFNAGILSHLGNPGVRLLAPCLPILPRVAPSFNISISNLRTTVGHVHRDSKSPSSAKQSSMSKNLRTEVCSHYLEGRCKFGSRCLKVHPH